MKRPKFFEDLDRSLSGEKVEDEAPVYQLNPAAFVDAEELRKIQAAEIIQETAIARDLRRQLQEMARVHENLTATGAQIAARQQIAASISTNAFPDVIIFPQKR